jgi:hypothetical protein
MKLEKNKMLDKSVYSLTHEGMTVGFNSVGWVDGMLVLFYNGEGVIGLEGLSLKRFKKCAKEFDCSLEWEWQL